MIPVSKTEKKILINKRLKNHEKWSKEKAEEDIEKDYEVEEKPYSKEVNTETI